MVVFYGQRKLWQERFYHGVVVGVGASVLREWAGEEFVQVRLRVDFGDGTGEVQIHLFEWDVPAPVGKHGPPKQFKQFQSIKRAAGGRLHRHQGLKAMPRPVPINLNAHKVSIKI